MLGCSQGQKKPPKKEDSLLLFFGVSFGDVSLKSSACTEIKVQTSLYPSEFLLKQKLLSSHGGENSGVNMGITAKKRTKLLIPSALIHFGGSLLLCL